MTEAINTSSDRRQFQAALDHLREAHIELIVECHDDDAETDRQTDVLTFAEDAVLALDAPDMAGLLAKFEIATFDNRTLQVEWIESIRRDLMRLGNLDRSPTFLPLGWLHQFETRGGNVLRYRGDVWLGHPLDNERAGKMLRGLKGYQQAAIKDHLKDADLDTWQPAPFGQEKA